MATLKDLAQQLNISVTTVSRALAGNPDISAATAQRVRALAKKLGYQPNPEAVGLRQGHTKILGVFTPHLGNNFFGRIVTGIEEAARQAGYRLLVCQSSDDTTRERQNINVLLHARVAGILLSLARTTHTFPQLVAAQQRRVPLVFFDRYLEGSQVDAVVVDDRAGGYRATRHLLDQGYRRIAHLAGPQHLSIYKNRRLGYEDALREAGLPIEPALCLYSDLHLADGVAATRQLLAQPQPPDAIFSASDFAAAGSLQALKEAGRQIPAEVGVVGFSNEFFAQLTEPGLTSVDQHGEEMGQAATRLLFQLLRAESTPYATQQVLLPPTLCIRASSQRKLLL